MSAAAQQGHGSSSGGRGCGCGWGGWAPFIPRKTGFKGDIKEIEDHVFDLIGGSKQAIKYDLMLNKICGYIGNVFDDSNELISCIKDNLTPASFPDPADLPENASQAVVR
jgi:hypothetical protein